MLTKSYFMSIETSYLTFPAITLLCLGGVPLRIANMQLANLFPKNRSTVITFYSGAFSASAIVFVILKNGYDHGISFFWACSTLVVCSLAMIPITFFLLPFDQVKDEQSPESLESLILNKKYHAKNQFANMATVTLEKFQIISSPRPVRKNSSGSMTSSETDSTDSQQTITSNNNSEKKIPISELDETVHQHLHQSVGRTDSVTPSSISVASSSVTDIPLKNSLFSLPFTLHQWWYSWLITYMIMYVGTMNLWIGRVTTDT